MIHINIWNVCAFMLFCVFWVSCLKSFHDRSDQIRSEQKGQLETHWRKKTCLNHLLLYVPTNLSMSSVCFLLYIDVFSWLAKETVDFPRVRWEDQFHLLAISFLLACKPVTKCLFFTFVFYPFNKWDTTCKPDSFFCHWKVDFKKKPLMELG